MFVKGTHRERYGMREFESDGNTSSTQRVSIEVVGNFTF